MSLLSTTWDIARAATAGLFGGLVAPWLLKTGERRKLRAEVRDALGQVEYLRSADDERTRKEFEEAIRRFETAALMARVPYEVSGQYVAAARKARRFTEHTFREVFLNPVTGEEVQEPILSPEYASILRSAADFVNSYLWRPVYSRIAFRRKKFDSKVKELNGEVLSLPHHPTQLQVERASQESLKEAMNQIFRGAGTGEVRIDRILIERVVREAAAFGFLNAATTQGREFRSPTVEWTENGEVARIVSGEGWVLHRAQDGQWREANAADILEEQRRESG